MFIAMSDGIKVACKQTSDWRNILCLQINTQFRLQLQLHCMATVKCPHVGLCSNECWRYSWMYTERGLVIYICSYT